MDYKETELCKLAFLYGTDKCPRLVHNYTPFYYELLKDKRQSIKKVLELGVGYYKTMEHVAVTYDRGLKRHYHKGASLYMWRDFLPNAQIYGADIHPEAVFKDERLETFLCDEREKEDLVRLVEQTGSDIDFFVDDGSHLKRNQVFTCQVLKPLLKKDVIYIIEDVRSPDFVIKYLNMYDCQLAKLLGKSRLNDCLVIVKDKA